MFSGLSIVKLILFGSIRNQDGSIFPYTQTQTNWWYLRPMEKLCEQICWMLRIKIYTCNAKNLIFAQKFIGRKHLQYWAVFRMLTNKPLAGDGRRRKTCFLPSPHITNVIREVLFFLRQKIENWWITERKYVSTSHVVES